MERINLKEKEVIDKNLLFMGGSIGTSGLSVN